MDLKNLVESSSMKFIRGGILRSCLIYSFLMYQGADVIILRILFWVISSWLSLYLYVIVQIGEAYVSVGLIMDL